MYVEFETPNGGLFGIELQPSDTVTEVKKKIGNQRGFPAETITLLCDGVVMEDDENIEHYSTALSMFRLATGQPLAGNRIKVAFEASSENEPVAPEVVKKTRIRVLVNSMISEREFDLEFCMNEKIGDMKRVVEVLERVPADSFTLSVGNSHLISDEMTLADYGITNRSKITVTPK